MNALNRPLSVIVLAAALFSLPVAAQQALDRAKIPPPGKATELRVPTWTKTTLSSGAELIVSEKHDLPLVSFSLIVLGGSDQFEPADRRGLASLTASMMSEGTKTRDGEALSNALQLLGTSVNAGIGGDSGAMGFVSTTGKFAQTLDLLADMLVNSTFPAPALDRLRAQRLVALNAARAQPGAIARRVFPKVLFGTAHPFGQLTTEETLAAITRDDVVAFLEDETPSRGEPAHRVSGDVTPATAKATVEKALCRVAGRRRQAGLHVPRAAREGADHDLPGGQAGRGAVHLRDRQPRPAAQHARLLRAAGDEHDARRDVPVAPEREHPRGEGLQLRRQLVVRVREGPGAFRAGGDIISAKSDAALVEFMKELRGLQGGSRPVTDEELATSKSSLVQSLPGVFGSVSSIGAAIGMLMDAGPAGRLLPAVREVDQRRHERGHRSRG